MKRTLTKYLPKKAGEKVRIQGWIHTIRQLGEIAFVLVREQTGFCQVVITKEQAEHLIPETVIEITGTVKKEPRAKQGVELVAETVKIISEPAEQPPVTIYKKIEPAFPTLMKYRPFTLRMEKQKAIIKVACRSDLCISRIYEITGVHRDSFN